MSRPGRRRKAPARSRGGRGGKRKPRRAGKAGRRRGVGIALGVLAAIAAAAALFGPGLLERTVREVTLPLRHDDIIRQQAKEKAVDADLIAAVIYSESRFRDQTSHAGARGLMQITPDAAETIEGLSGGETFVLEDLADPDINIRYGTFFLRWLLDRYEGNEVAALAAYNAGFGHADEWGGSGMDAEDIRFDETRAYVDQVLEKKREYRKNYGDELGL